MSSSSSCNSSCTTKVVNVKVSYIRPKYDDLKQWCEDRNNLYIGRRGIVFIKDESGTKKRFPSIDSPWANPFKLNKDSSNLDEVLVKYEEYIKNQISTGKVNLKELEGKNLGCWCKPSSCHGDILLKLLDESKK